MKKTLSTIALASAMALPAVGATTAELESRIEDLELSRDLNVFSFKGELDTRYESIKSENNLTNTGATKDLYSMFLRLDMEAKPSEKMVFHGRLAMSKYFNAFSVRDTSGGVVSNSGAGGRDRSGSEVYVERAFFNYAMPWNLTLSVGRLPTIEGPSYHLSKGSAREGTYPQLAYGSILDGLGLTHSSKVVGGNLATRFVFTPVNFQNKDTGALDSNAVDSSGAKVDTSTPMFAAMVDYTNVSTSFADKLNAIVQFVSIKDFYINSDSRNCASTTQSTNPCPASQSDPVSEASNLKFDYDTLVLYTELTNIANTGLDFGLTVKGTQIDSKGSLSGVLGVFGGADAGKKKGNQYLVSARYSFMNMFKLGYEFQKATRYAFATGVADTNPIGFYTTPASTGHHAYLTTDFDQNLRLILGYVTMNLDHQYTSSILGSGSAADLDRTAGYARLIANF